MLYINWLLFSGGLAQARINFDVTAPVTGASVAIFYSAGVVFSVAATILLLYELYLLFTGKLSDDELVMVKESEEQSELEAIQKELNLKNANSPAGQGASGATKS